MKVIIGLLLGVVCVILSAQADPRMWGTEGIPIRQGQHINWNQTMVRDASGNTLVVWSDKRAGDRDVRAQLFNSAGAEQWAAGGINVAPDDRHQDNPVAVAVSGGWIVAWLDYRHCYLEDGCSDVYAQKLDNAGNRLWADNDYTGVAVDVAERWVWKPSLSIVPDGAGGAFLAWADSRADYNIYSQRILANGTVAWPQALVVNDQDYTQLCATSGTDGSMLIAWSGGYAYANVYLSRVMPDGTLPWGLAGMPVCTQSANHWRARIAPDGAYGCYVAWEDSRNGDFDIYAQHLSSDGQPLWTVNGIPLCTAENDQSYVEIAPSFDGATQDGFVAVWEDQRASWNYWEVYGQKVLADSSTVWPANGLRISGEPQDNVYASEPVVTTDHNGGLICAWEDSHNSQRRLMAARVNDEGNPVWSSDPVPVGALTYQQWGAVVGGDFGTYSVAWLETDTLSTQSVRYQLLDHGDGARLLGDAGVAAMTGFSGQVDNSRCTAMSGHRTALVWEDQRPGAFGTMLYYQIVGPEGAMERAVNGEPLASNNTGYGQFSQQRPTTSEDGNGGVLVGFVDVRNGTKLIRISHITYTGEVVSPDSGALVWWTPGIRDQDFPRIVSDGQGGCYVAWSGYSANFWIDVYVMRLNSDLEPMWQQPVRLTETFPDDILCALVGSSDNCCMAVWQSGDLGDYNISAAKICADGSVAWNDTLCALPGYQDRPVAVSDGSGGMYVAWNDWRTEANDLDIYAQRVAPDGTTYWTPNGVPVSTEAFNQSGPQITVDSRGDLNMVWGDFRDGQTFRVYAQKLSPNGELRWTESGVVVNVAGNSYIQSLVASEGRNGILPVWIDGRGYSEDAFATHLDSTGAVYGDPFWRPDSGGAVAGPLHDGGHFDASAVSDGWGGCVVALRRYSIEYEGGEGGDFTVDLFVQRIFDYASNAQKPEDLMPREFALYQNYPNPFNPETVIRFELPHAGRVRLAVYNLLGREVRVLTDAPLAAGTHHVKFDASTLPSGVYVYRLEAGDFRRAKKLVLLR